MKRKNNNRSSRTKVALIVLCVILAIVLAALIFLTAYVESWMNRLNRDVNNETLSSSEVEQILQQEATGTGPTVREDDIDFGKEPTVTIGGEEIVNILLIGQDRRPGEGRQRSDAMILCTINVNTKTLTMTSFLRDMYVQIPGYRNNKINVTTNILYFGLPLTIRSFAMKNIRK